MDYGGSTFYKFDVKLLISHGIDCCSARHEFSNEQLVLRFLVLVITCKRRDCSRWIKCDCPIIIIWSWQGDQCNVVLDRVEGPWNGATREMMASRTYVELDPSHRLPGPTCHEASQPPSLFLRRKPWSTHTVTTENLFFCSIRCLTYIVKNVFLRTKASWKLISCNCVQIRL
jgi:hypothetical protein